LLHDSLQLGQLFLMRHKENFRIPKLRSELFVSPLDRFTFFARGGDHLEDVKMRS
jgi:hypothetical protein